MTFDPQTSGDQAPDASRHKFVSFFIGETHYAMPAYAVSEVVARLAPTRLPEAPSSLLGIAPLRGDIIAVVNVGAATVSVQASKQKAVVLRPQTGCVELPIAFNVDRLGELLQIDESEIMKLGGDDPLADLGSIIDGRCVRLVEPFRIQDLLSEMVQ